MSLYEPLRRHLRSLPLETTRGRLRFGEIEALLGRPLPPSAVEYRAWWSNSPSHPLMRVVNEEGWLQVGLELRPGRVTLERGSVTLRVRGRRPLAITASPAVQ